MPVEANFNKENQKVQTKKKEHQELYHEYSKAAFEVNCILKKKKQLHCKVC